MTTFAYDGDATFSSNLEISSFGQLKPKITGRKICVFLGAGFSKAWDDKYPLSDDLFSITEDESLENADEYGFFSLFEGLNFKWAELNSSAEEKRRFLKVLNMLLMFIKDIRAYYPLI